MRKHNQIHTLGTPHYKAHFRFLRKLTLWRPAAFGDFQKKKPRRAWLCTGNSLVRYALQTR